MSARAEVRLAGPEKPSDQLFVAGFCPESFVKQPLRLTVKAAGQTVGELEITSLNSTFDNTFPLPQTLIGQPEMLVELSVNRTVTLPGDGRALGLVFGRIGLR
jgi:hypothetical protein